MKEDEIEKIIEKFKKIMGPVAETLAFESAKELGAQVAGNRISVKDDQQYRSFIAKLDEKYGKIIGKELTSNLLKE